LLGPIFVREWLTVPRRSRHYVVRAAYLGLLWVLGVTAWQATVGWSQTATLGDAARFGLLLFQGLTMYVQLPLVVFFAALSSASAVAREKDRRTFVLLLMTDLRNYEIVLGKFLGSVLQIGLLLAGMVPVLGLLLLLGGVAPYQVGEAALVLAAAALAAGSLGGLVALWRDKTFQALALTVLFLILYLLLVRGLAVVPQLAGQVSWLRGFLTAAHVEEWQKWLDPFLALQSVLEPPLDEVAGLSPAFGFAIAMVVLSALLNGWAILRLRAWNPRGEPIMQRERPEDDEDKDRARAHAAPGAVRRVWANPILWREIGTRAYGRRPLLVKAAYFLVLFLVCYFALAPLWTSGSQGPGRISLLSTEGLAPVGILTLGLLLVSAQAVTAITSERDSGALDLLLVTDLTPQEFIFGKIWGVVWNAKEYLLPPLLLAGVYACYGLLATPPRAHPEMWVSKNVEAYLAVAGGSLVLLAFAAVLGLHVALRTENSQLAIVNTLGTVFFLSVGTGVCIGLILINGRFEAQWFSFIFFLAAGIGGLWWVLSGDRPSPALTLAAFLCPPGVFYTVTNILVGKPGSEESADPLIPFLVVAGVFGFTVAAMLVPLLSEFDVALGRTTGGAE
jgi:ABC-type transport system involved in multi-copper enzyme maturation permease subunit